MMEKILRISILFLLLVFCGCVNHETIDDSVFNSNIKNIYSKNKKSIIDFSKIVPVKWDRMYIIDADNFPEIDSEKEISKLIGIKYTGSKDNELDRAIIFVKNNQIVYEIFSKFNETSWGNNEYFVNFLVNEKIIFFTSQEAKFSIEYKVDKKEGFNLIPLRR